MSVAVRSNDAFPWEFVFLLTMLKRQPWCACGRGFFPDRAAIAAMSEGQPMHACECGEVFSVREGYLRAFTKDYTREAQVAFLSNWAQAGYVDSTERSERVHIRLANPKPGFVIDVLTHPQILYPQDVHASPSFLHELYLGIGVAAVNQTVNGVELLLSHDLPPGWTLRTTWRAYGRRRILELPPWRELLHQALLVERHQILDPAIGLFHASFEAFANDLLLRRLMASEGLDANRAAIAIDDVQDGLSGQAKRAAGAVIALLDAMRERCGLPALTDTPAVEDWNVRVRRPRNAIFHGESLKATAEQARLAFAATIRLMDFLDPQLTPSLVLECYDGLDQQ